MSERHEHSGSRTAALPRRAYWPGWIWAVPVAAALIGAWLLVRSLAQGGTEITISFANVHGIREKETNVEFRGMKVGHVTALAIGKNGLAIQVKAQIDDDATRYLKQGTVFWLNGAHPSLSNLSSLGAVLAGPTIEMEPGPGAKATHFNGIEHKPAILGPHGTPVYFRAAFQGAVGSISEGDPVTLRGFTVGQVSNVGFNFDKATGELHTPVAIALYPSRMHLPGGEDFAAALQKAIRAGLRARLDRDPPLVGGYEVTLEYVPGAPSPLPDSSPYDIPVAPGGGLQTVVDRLKNVPLDQIAQNLLNITKHVDAIVSSPKLKDSVAALDASLQQIRKTTAEAGPKITALVAQLRHTADRIDDVAKAADKVVGGTPSQHGLNPTLAQIDDAARSVRELADYLDRHPESIIKGRSGQ